jgi:hypothetical protein
MPVATRSQSVHWNAFVFCCQDVVAKLPLSCSKLRLFRTDMALIVFGWRCSCIRATRFPLLSRFRKLRFPVAIARPLMDTVPPGSDVWLRRSGSQFWCACSADIRGTQSGLENQRDARMHADHSDGIQLSTGGFTGSLLVLAQPETEGAFSSPPSREVASPIGVKMQLLSNRPEMTQINWLHGFAFQLFQPPQGVIILRIQLQRLFITLDRQVLLPRLQVRLTQAHSKTADIPEHFSGTPADHPFPFRHTTMSTPSYSRSAR